MKTTLGLVEPTEHYASRGQGLPDTIRHLFRSG